MKNTHNNWHTWFIVLMSLFVTAAFSADTIDANEFSSNPDDKTLMLVYKHMRDTGNIDQQLMMKNPDYDTLLKVYDLAMESGEIESELLSQVDNGDSFQMSVKPSDIEPRGIMPSNQVKSSNQSNQCKINAATCAWTATGAVLACMGTAETGGLLTWPCYSLVGGAGASCATAANNCPTGTPQLGTRQLGIDGSSYNSKETLKTCGGTNRVRKIRVWSDSHYLNSSIDVVTKIRLYCTDDTTLDFLNNIGRGYGTSWCNAGRMAQGLNVRAGSWIDGAGIICDRVYDTDEADWHGRVWGGRGGSNRERLCPEGEYVYGLRTFHDDTLPNDKQWVKGMEVLCRKKS